MASNKLQLLKERRERWSRQKEIAQIQQQQQHEQQTAPFAPSSSITQNDNFQNNISASNNAKALNTLTEKIARRLRKELENDPDILKNRTINKLNAAKDAEKKAQTASQYQCGICFELLYGKRLPKIIVPCGHTFCKICLDHHIKVNAGNKCVCPYCRAKIQSTAVNHHLRQLVEAYAESKQVGQRGSNRGNSSNSCSSSSDSSSNQDNSGAGGGGMAGARYLREYNMLKTRRKILMQEETETKEEIYELERTYHRHVEEEKRIRMEEKQAALDVEAAKRRLARIRTRLQEQQIHTLSVKEQKELSDTKLNMIKSTLATICKDADKAHILATAQQQLLQQQSK